MSKVKKPVFRTTPESGIQDSIIDFLELRGWVVEKMHGNAFQKGIPDLYCFNPNLGFEGEGLHRWVDVKYEKRYSYTKAQCQTWVRWEKKKLGVWIMMGATDDWYSKLFQPPNFRDYWKPRYDQYLLSIEEVIDDILD